MARNGAPDLNDVKTVLSQGTLGFTGRNHRWQSPNLLFVYRAGNPATAKRRGC